MTAPVWIPAEPHPERLVSNSPAGLRLLVGHLTEDGREAFFGDLLAAVAEDGAVRAVLRKWWTTFVLRNDPGFVEAIQRPTPPPEERVYQTTAEMRAEVEALMAGRSVPGRE